MSAEEGDGTTRRGWREGLWELLLLLLLVLVPVPVLVQVQAQAQV